MRALSRNVRNNCGIVHSRKGARVLSVSNVRQRIQKRPSPENAR